MKKTSNLKKFTIAVSIIIIIVLYLTWHTGTVTIDYNGMFNGILQTAIGGLFGSAMTIWIYRTIYHKKSKN